MWMSWDPGSLWCFFFANDKVRGGFSLEVFFCVQKKWVLNICIYIYLYYIIYLYIYMYLLYIINIYILHIASNLLTVSMGVVNLPPFPRVVRKNAATCVRCLAEDLGNTGTDVTGAEWPPTLPWRFVCSQTNGLIGKRGIGSDGCKVVVIILSSVSLMFPCHPYYGLYMPCKWLVISYGGSSVNIPLLPTIFMQFPGSQESSHGIPQILRSWSSPGIRKKIPKGETVGWTREVGDRMMKYGGTKR